MARLRSGESGSVAVGFDEPLADSIQEALRTPPKQLAMNLEPGGFWRDLTIEELRAAHGVRPVTADTELGDDALTDEEAGAFLAALTP